MRERQGGELHEGREKGERYGSGKLVLSCIIPLLFCRRESFNFRSILLPLLLCICKSMDELDTFVCIEKLNYIRRMKGVGWKFF